jgi:DUF3089 family protein
MGFDRKVATVGRGCVARWALAVAVVTATAALAPAAGAQAPTVWLCRPGLQHNPCLSSLTATVQTGTGASHVQRARRARRPAIDCFYVYPTVSAQPGAIANRHIDPEERAIAINQAARFSQVCRVFAPMYRQLTLAAINGGAPVTAAQRARAFADVRAAWRDYLAHDNHGRGVVLIGHSQGSFMLTQLIKEEIDGRRAVRRRLVSALLLGGNVQVPIGRDVGGDFRHIPACRSSRELGCVVAYSSFDQPPPADSLFGRVPGRSTRQVLCVNPAALRGGTAALHPYS